MKKALVVIDVQNVYFTRKLPVTYPPARFSVVMTTRQWLAAAGSEGKCPQ